MKTKKKHKRDSSSQPANTIPTCFMPRAFLCRILSFSCKQNGKRTIVLSDLEIDRGRKQAKADEILPYSKFEREVQGTRKKTPPFEKVLSHFLRKRGVRSALVPANFPLGFARELAANKIRLRTTNGLFWPERETKNEAELRLMRRASVDHRSGNGARDGSPARRKTRPWKETGVGWSHPDLRNFARGN